MGGEGNQSKGDLIRSKEADAGGWGREVKAGGAPRENEVGEAYSGGGAFGRKGGAERLDARAECLLGLAQAADHLQSRTAATGDYRE